MNERGLNLENTIIMLVSHVRNFSRGIKRDANAALNVNALVTLFSSSCSNKKARLFKVNRKKLIHFLFIIN